MGFFRGLKEGYQDLKPPRFEIAGKIIACSHCGGKHFDRSDALLNTSGMSLLGLDWANRQAAALICSDCSHIEWFAAEPNQLPDA